MVEFSSETIWAGESFFFFFFGVLKYKFNFLNSYRLFKKFHVSWVATVCGFWGSSLVHLNCQGFVCGVVRCILLLSFWCLQGLWWYPLSFANLCLLQVFFFFQFVSPARDLSILLMFSEIHLSVSLGFYIIVISFIYFALSSLRWQIIDLKLSSFCKDLVLQIFLSALI